MMGWLPFVVAIIPAIYYLILIYESKTVQGFVERRRERNRVKLVAKLKAKAIVVSAQIEAAKDVHVAQVFADAKVDNAAVYAKKLVDTTAAAAAGSTGTDITSSLPKASS